MFELFSTKNLPILLFFIIGYTLKATNILKRDEASVLLKLVFYLLAPAVIVMSISTMKINEL